MATSISAGGSVSGRLRLGERTELRAQLGGRVARTGNREYGSTAMRVDGGGRRPLAQGAAGLDLDDDEVEAFFERVAALRTAGVFPEPPSDRYPLPWPPL